MFHTRMKLIKVTVNDTSLSTIKVIEMSLLNEISEISREIVLLQQFSQYFV